MPVKPTGSAPLTTIELGVVTSPAVAPLHTVALYVSGSPTEYVLPPGVVSATETSSATGVGVAVGVGGFAYGPSGSGWAFDAVVFLVLAVLTSVFVWSAPVTRWLRRAG